MPVFSVESAMVVVDVTVRDGKGKLVDDLKKEDFKIYEDNIPQNIVTFSAENVAIGPAPAVADQGSGNRPAPTSPKPRHGCESGAQSANAPVKKEDLADKRLVILFFDLSSLETENLIRSVDAAHDFIAKQTGPQDLMAIATYSSTLSLVQDFTNDRDLLLKTLKEISSRGIGSKCDGNRDLPANRPMKSLSPTAFSSMSSIPTGACRHWKPWRKCTGNFPNANL